MEIVTQQKLQGLHRKVPLTALLCLSISSCSSLGIRILSLKSVTESSKQVIPVGSSFVTRYTLRSHYFLRLLLFYQFVGEMACATIHIPRKQVSPAHRSYSCLQWSIELSVLYLHRFVSTFLEAATSFCYVRLGYRQQRAHRYSGFSEFILSTWKGKFSTAVGLRQRNLENEEERERTCFAPANGLGDIY